MFVTKWVKEANIQQTKVKMQQETSNRVILYQKKILQECVIIGDDGVKFLCGIYVHYNTLSCHRSGKVVRTFLKGAYLKRCHKTIKGFSYDPLWVVLVLHSLRIFHILASILAPMSRNDIDAIGDKFCPLSKDQVLELGLHTLRQKKSQKKI